MLITGAGHVIQLYEDDAFLIDVLARFVASGLGAGDTVVLIITAEHQRALDAELQARGLALSLACDAGRCIVLDAADTLRQIMDEDGPDPARFRSVISDRLARAVPPAQRMRVFGEMVALLWAEGRREAALRLEALWSECSNQRGGSLLCGYPLRLFGTDADREALVSVCGRHDRVVPAESYPEASDTDARLRAVVELQQRAQALAPAVAERQAAERALHERDELLAAIVDSSDDAIIGKTLEGVVTTWNRGAERIFGYAAAEMIGQPITRIVPPEREADVTTILAAIARGERVDHYETDRICKDGTRITVSLSVAPIRDASGCIVGASKIARDITEQKRAAERLYAAEQRARVAAEEANRAKDRFMAMLGHELRNPLAAIRNAITAAGVDPTRRQRALEIARRGADQLTRLVDDLLDMARITHGRLTLRREPLALAGVVEQSIDSVRPLFEERSLAITLALPAEDLEVQGDAGRLEQVITNLLVNAAKYTEPGGRVTVTLEHAPGEAVLRVRDTGIGIAPAMLSRIFELFVQADRSHEHAGGGFGIGLTLVKQLVELHGGRVEARSGGVGQGAEFTVRLPAVVRAHRDPLNTALPAPPRRSHARVLIVEDNVDAAESMAMLLELLGLEVRAVGNGPSALEAALANPPDVMLVDIGLPGMSGYELAEHIRRHEQLRDVTLVALTGYGQEEDRQQSFAAGFDYHLVKPVDLTKVQDLVTGLEPSRRHSIH